MISTRFQSAAVALLFIALTVFMTWPQAGHLGSWVYDNDERFARARGVRDMTAALLARPDIEAVAQIEEPRGADAVFRLRR